MKAHLESIEIRPEVAEKLCYYVYAYVDPRNSEIFYVGKGCGTRALSHLNATGESEKNRRLAELKRANLQPRIDILTYGIETEEIALRVECTVIDVLWPGKTLTNKVRGFQALEFGRVSLAELEFLYAAKPVTIEEPALLFRINQLYRPGMNSEALYEATRGVWKCGIGREKALYAFAVYKGVVREVYEIETWHKAGTLEYRTRPCDEVTNRTVMNFQARCLNNFRQSTKANPLNFTFPKARKRRSLM